MPTLPPKLISEILAPLHDENSSIPAQDLLNCCLVSTEFAEAARDLLYREATFYLARGDRNVEGPSGLSRDLVPPNEDEDCEAFGVDRTNPLPTLVANKELGKRVQSIAFDMGLEDTGYEGMDWTDYEQLNGELAMANAVGSFFFEVRKACPRATKLCLYEVPAWVIKGIRLGIGKRALAIEEVIAIPYEAIYIDERPKRGVDASLVKLLHLLPALKRLEVRHEVFEPQRKLWKRSPEPEYRLEELNLTVADAAAFSFFTSSSTATLRDLDIEDFRAFSSLDLSAFTALESVAITFKPEDMGKSELVKAKAALLDWIPPPSLLNLTFSPVDAMSSRLPLIPPTVRHLSLSLDSGTFRKDGRGEPTFETITEKYPVISAILQLVTSHPQLHYFSLQDEIFMPPELAAGYPESAREALRSVCDERGIFLDDMITEFIEMELEHSMGSWGSDSDDGSWTTEEYSS